MSDDRAWFRGGVVPTHQVLDAGPVGDEAGEQVVVDAEALDGGGRATAVVVAAAVARRVRVQTALVAPAPVIMPWFVSAILRPGSVAMQLVPLTGLVFDSTLRG